MGRTASAGFWLSGFFLIILCLFLFAGFAFALADCTGTDLAPCGMCDLNAIQFEIRAPDDATTTGWVDLAYSSQAGTCGTTPEVTQTWIQNYGYVFCAQEGAYDARTQAGAQGDSGYEWEVGDWNTGFYTVNYDNDSLWCACKGGTWVSGATYCGTSGCEGGKCCGDDGSNDNFCVAGGASCIAGTYYANHCSDNSKNCDEEATDCGGADCSACVQAVVLDPNGNQYINGSAYGIDFNVYSPGAGSELHAKIAYSSSAGSFTNIIIADVNLNNDAGVAALSCTDTDWSDQTTCTYNWDTTAATDGNYYLDLNVSTRTGGIAIDSSDASFYIDNVGPATANDYNGAWRRNDLNVTLSCNDGLGRGCSTTYYCVDDANTCTPTTSGTVALVSCASPNYCQKYVRYYSTDLLSNNGTTTATQVINIDRNNPTYAGYSNITGYSYQESSTVYWVHGGDDFNIDISHIDVGSGMYRQYLGFDQDDCTPGSCGGGPAEIKSYLTNASTFSDYPGDINDGYLNITAATCVDADSNCGDNDLTLRWRTIVNSNCPDMNYKLHTYGHDRVLNGSGYADLGIWAKVDNNAPTTTDNSSTSWTGSDATVTLTCSDTRSDCGTTYYCVDTTDTCTPTTSGTSVSVTCASGSICQQYVRYYSTDNVGNAEAVNTSALVRIDKQAPTPNPATIAAVIADSNAQITIIASTASDGSGAGLSATPYDFNVGGSWQGYQASATYTKTGLTPNTQYCYSVRYRDTLGNATTASSVSCKYTRPGNPVPISTSHTANQWSNDSTVDFTCSGAASTYYYVWDQSSSTAATTSSTSWNGSSLTKTATDDGNWYLHVISANADGNTNASGTYHLGPFKIDTKDPRTRANPPEGWQLSDFNVPLYCGDGYTTSNLVSYWKLNESTGTTATDSQGGHNGTLTNFPGDNSQWKTGIISGALDFDGSNDYVTTADHADLDFAQSESFSIDLWVKRDTNGADQILLAKKVSSAGDCSGSSTACASLATGSSCSDQNGCSWDAADCSGTCTGCTSLGTSGTCTGQGGCSWDTEDCYGSPTACTSLGTSGTCASQGGCSWDAENCYGTCTACSSMGTSGTCTPQAGCSWDSADCYGTATTCSSLGTSETCTPQGGCAWDAAGPCSGTPAYCGDYFVSGECSTAGCSWDSENCYGTCTTCTSHGTSGTCTAQGGCSWDAAGPCSGSGYSCSSWSNNTECGLAGCSWDIAGPCGGAATSCSSFSNPTDCEAQAGCSDAGYGCEGTATTCSSIGYNSSACSAQAGCSYDSAGPCSGTKLSCGTWSASDDCDWAGCSWDSANCYGNCTSCTTFSDDESVCNEQGGCSWDASNCYGTPYACSTYSNSSSCGYAICQWDAADCYGTANACTSYGTSGTCTPQAGCSWDAEGPCSGTCTGCSTYGTSGTCTPQAGCSWDSADCYGTATPCTSYGTSGTCSAQTGCSWDSADCYGTCTSCTSIGTEGTCTAEGGCSWDAAGPCSGTAATCSNLTQQSSCQATTGCSWSGSGTGYSLEISSGNTLKLYLNDGTDSATISSNSIISSGKWHHVSASFNRDTNKVRLYIDANLDKEETVNNMNDLSNTVALLFGQNADNGLMLDGMLDDVKLYSAALTMAEVEKNYASDGNIYASGCSDTQHRIDSSAWIDSNNVQINTDGNKQVDYNSTDVAGNIEDMRTFWGALDKSWPSTSGDANCAWRDSNLSITLTPADTGSGISSTYYCMDDANTCAPTTSGTSLTIGCNSGQVCSKYARYYSADLAGHTESISSTCLVRIDKQDPSVSDNTSASWSDSNQTITLTCSDGSGSGCATTKYCTYDDGSSACSPASGTSGTSVSVGCNSDSAVQKRISYYSKDNIDHNSGIKTSTYAVKIDKQKPATSNNAPSGWQTANFSFSLACDDSTGSGCASSAYRINSGDWNSNSTVWITTDGNHSIDYNSKDAVGNIETTKTVRAALDKTAPSTSDNAPSGWQTSDFNVTISCTDATSGCLQTYYDLNYTGWTDDNLVRITGDGNYRLDYNSQDVAGNRAANKTKWIALDKTKPSTTDDANTAWQSTNQTITLTPADATSGVNTTQYVISYASGSGTPSTTGTSVSATCADNNQCTMHVRYRSTDRAGLVEDTKEATIRIDKNVPYTYHSTIGSCTSSDFNVYIYCSDNTGSGCSATKYRLDTDATSTVSYGSWADYSGNLEFASDGNYALQFYSQDAVGNVSATQTKYAVLDKTEPTTSHDSNSNWRKNDLNVALSPSDGAGCGISATYYCVDDDNSCTPGSSGTTASITCDANSVCQTYLRYNSLDHAGLAETVKALLVKIDKQNPGTTDDGNTDWQSASQSVTLTPTDYSGSGISATYYCSDDTNACTPSTSGTSIAISADANSISQKYIRYYSVDSAGNNETVKYKQMRVDNQKPASIAVFAGGWNGDVNVPFSCTDYNGSGCKKIKYRVDGGDWNESVFSGSDINVLFNTDGNHLVEYYSLDNVDNNESVKSGRVAVDKSPPSITITDPATDQMEKGISTIAFSIGKLNGSNIDLSSIVVDFNGTPSDDFNALADCTETSGDYGCAYTELNLPEDDYNLSVYSKDAANNSRKNSRAFRLKAIIGVRSVTPSGGLVTGTQQAEFEVKNTMLNAVYVKIFVSGWFDNFDSNISGTMNLDNYGNYPGLSCEGTTWWAWTGCTYGWDSAGVADGNYFIDINFYNASGGTTSGHSSRPFLVDNTPPVANVGGVSSTPVYSNRVYLGCSDSASGCKKTKWYYFSTEPLCSASKSTYSLSTIANYIDITTDRSDYICLWVEDLADFNATAVSAQLHVETGVYVVSSIPSESMSIATQDLNNECRMYMDQNITVECAFKSTIKISEYEKDLNRVWQESPQLVVSPPKTIRVLVQSEIEAFYNKDYFLKFESEQRTITSQGNENDYPTVVVRRRVMPLLTTGGQLEVGTLTIKIRAK
jgi:hypothetical protein